MKPRWIPQTAPKPGALHRQIGWPANEPIPDPVLYRIKYLPVGGRIHGQKVTRLMKQRANVALNVRR